jgi:hypothetical protein
MTKNFTSSTFLNPSSKGSTVSSRQNILPIYENGTFPPTRKTTLLSLPGSMRTLLPSSNSSLNMTPNPRRSSLLGPVISLFCEQEPNPYLPLPTQGSYRQPLPPGNRAILETCLSSSMEGIQNMRFFSSTGTASCHQGMMFSLLQLLCHPVFMSTRL